MTPRELALEIWTAGVAAVGGYAATRVALEQVTPPDHILAVGKAAPDMARAALERFPGTPTLVVTKDGHANAPLLGAEVIESAHPIPDERSLTAGAALQARVTALPADARLLFLVSGGASSLAEHLTPGHDLNDLRRLNDALLSEGLDITQMNACRRRLSRIKGGNLLRAFNGGAVDVLAISDVPGDDLGVIGSGIGLIPDNVPWPGQASIIANNTTARTAAAERAGELGLTVINTAESLHAPLPELVQTLAPQIHAMPKGVMILGGEPTVHLPANPGRGGRNQALGLALAQAIQNRDDITLIVGGTDGTDGPTQDAGAIIDGNTWSDASTQFLAAADSGTDLAQKNALLTVGPTGTNVMDLAVVLRL